jgi:alpha-beta hydrolase superfamily lysophospholipase
MSFLNIIYLKIVLGFCKTGIVTYLSICLFLLFYQTRLIFSPSSEIKITPNEIGLVYEDVWLQIRNPQQNKFEQIHGWWLPNSNSNAPVLLYLHGNGENISGNLGRAQFYHQQGFSVFLIDYRGYGKSLGQFPNEMRVYEDAQLAYDYLVQERQVQPKSIFLYGHSLGGAIAINLAVNQPEISGLIVESTFTSIQDVAEINPFYRLFPLDLIVSEKFESIKKINRLKTPILIIHGTEDELIPFSMSRMLYNSVQTPKNLLIVEGANHNNVRTTNEQQYSQAINKFVNYVQNPERVFINY